MWERGVSKGEYDGVNSNRQLRFDLECTSAFKKIDKTKSLEQLNVCFLLPESICNNGGSVKHTMELAKGLIKNKINIHIVYYGKENMDYLKDEINFHSISSHHLSISILEPFPVCNNLINISYSAYLKIITLIKMYNIQVVETPLWDFCGLLCAEFLDIPVVTRLQTPAKIVNNVHEYKETNDDLLHYELEKRLLENSSGIIAVSDCITKTITDSYNIEFGDKVEKNYGGIEDSEFEAVRHKDGKIIIFFIGRLERRKGIANIIEVIPNILSKHKDVEFRLAGADVHDNVLRTTFKKYFMKKYRHLLNRVSFLGVISDEQKEQELESCDIFVSPSLYESFGYIFIEAMRHKKPVIGCNTGGMPEVVDNCITGLLCEPDNSADLEKALCTLIEDKEKRETMGQKGYDRFKKMFTREKMVQGTLEIYKKVIENYQKKQVQ
jgi:glycosyltransferase involved in cell wall biosynthesis